MSQRHAVHQASLRAGDGGLADSGSCRNVTLAQAFVQADSPQHSPDPTSVHRGMLTPEPHLPLTW